MEIGPLEKRFGTIAVEKGFITIDQLVEAMDIQVMDNVEKGEHRPIGRILLAQGLLTIPPAKYLLPWERALVNPDIFKLCKIYAIACLTPFEHERLIYERHSWLQLIFSTFHIKYLGQLALIVCRGFPVRFYPVMLYCRDIKSGNLLAIYNV